jgi:Terpene cyclase DEP1
MKLLDGFYCRVPSCAFMKPRHFYLICCALGFVLPYSQFVPWVLEHGLNFGLFFRELLANRISAFFAMDVILSAIVLIWFIHSEGKRLRVRLLWLPTIGTLLVGVSLGFPLFLFLRQAMLDRTTARA